jgi:hypothetical protein
MNTNKQSLLAITLLFYSLVISLEIQSVPETSEIAGVQEVGGALPDLKPMIRAAEHIKNEMYDMPLEKSYALIKDRIDALNACIALHDYKEIMGGKKVAKNGAREKYLALRTIIAREFGNINNSKQPAVIGAEVAQKVAIQESQKTSALYRMIPTVIFGSFQSKQAVADLYRKIGEALNLADDAARLNVLIEKIAVTQMEEKIDQELLPYREAEKNSDQPWSIRGKFALEKVKELDAKVKELSPQADKRLKGWMELERLMYARKGISGHGNRKLADEEKKEFYEVYEALYPYVEETPLIFGAFRGSGRPVFRIPAQDDYKVTPAYTYFSSGSTSDERYEWAVARRAVKNSKNLTFSEGVIAEINSVVGFFEQLGTDLQKAAKTLKREASKEAAKFVMQKAIVVAGEEAAEKYEEAIAITSKLGAQGKAKALKLLDEAAALTQQSKEKMSNFIADAKAKKEELKEKVEAQWLAALDETSNFISKMKESVSNSDAQKTKETPSTGASIMGSLAEKMKDMLRAEGEALHAVENQAAAEELKSQANAISLASALGAAAGILPNPSAVASAAFDSINVVSKKTENAEGGESKSKSYLELMGESVNQALTKLGKMSESLDAIFGSGPVIIDQPNASKEESSSSSDFQEWNKDYEATKNQWEEAFVTSEEQYK